MRAAVYAALLVALSFTGSLTAVPAAAQDRTIDSVIDDVIEQAIRPGFAAFKREADAMADATTSLCSAPVEETMLVAQARFGDLVTAWGRVEYIRLGPLSQDNRLERILFWPDRRGRGLQQIQRVIVTGDETALNADTLSNKSVAVQGLAALEFALFGTGQEDIVSGADPDRCVYVAAVSENIARIAADVFAGWQGEDGIAALWRNPSADNPLFRNEAEQINGLIKLIGNAVEIMHVQRLDPILRDDRTSMRPKSALFWRSDNTVRSLSANVAGLQALLAVARLDETVTGDGARVLGTLNFELSNAVGALAATNLPMAEIAGNDEAYGRLNYVRIIMNGLVTLTDGQLPAVYGLSSGFSSLDGD